MNLATIPPHVPFLDALAEDWLARAGDDALRASEGLILLPTRRAARAMTEAFLRASGGRALLLPRIAAFGALDEAPLALSGVLDLPPAVDVQVRLALLTRMVMALDGKYGAPATADRAWPLAAELAALLDEVARSEVDFPAALPRAAEAGFAEHWQRTVDFLRIVTSTWPEVVTEHGLMDIGQRQVALLNAQAEAWTVNPPQSPILAAGTTGGIPAVARLLRIVAGLPQGRVVLPGLDLDMDDDAWDQVTEGHPQAGMKRLLAGLGAIHGDVAPWPERETLPSQTPVPPARAATLWRALLPAAALSAWRRPVPSDVNGLFRLAPADQQEEAVAIALLLRDALETPGARAALVTPDRELATRVSAELARFGVVADDSAGEALAETPPAVFLRLLARAVAEGLAPVPLLGLLKHPLAAAGMKPAACRAAARRLEIACLRGPRPAPGIEGLRETLAKAGAHGPAAMLLDRLETILTPLARIAVRSDATPDEALAALVESAEALAATDETPGGDRLWSGEEGAALAVHLSGLQAALPVLPAQPVASLPGLLEASMAGAVVRGRRALRGRDEEGGEHPRIFIWGLLEARLQSVDLVVLGGLAETVWPPATDPGPWLSRPMRAAVGLPSPEERVGQMAHDFVMTACAAPRAILSCPRRREGTPAVPARWLARLDAMLRGQEGGPDALPLHQAAAWAGLLDQPDGSPRPVPPPQPRPPVELRPRRLRITEVETWLRDPYAIYARHVLRLDPLPELDEPADAADYGIIVHAALADFLGGIGPAWPADAEARIMAAMDRALEGARLRPALAAWWRPRLRRIAAWVLRQEAARRARHIPLRIGTELPGDWTFDCPSGPFRLRGRADRIERREDGTLAILDYKTGVLPNPGDVETGFAPQLPLEAAMAGAAAFGPDYAGTVAELTYWRLSGGFEPGEPMTLFDNDPAHLAEVIETARDRVCALAGTFDDPAQPYLSHPNPSATPRFSPYAQLARVAEWSAASDGG